MERLAFIRYLYQLGVEQSRKPEPANAVAILMLHDAADSLLQLASEHLNAPPKKKGNAYLMDYFEAVEGAVSARGNLDGATAMRRLSKARDTLKHHGVRPLSRDVEGLRVGCTNFFETNTPLVFGVEFDRISMALLIVIEEAKDALEESEALIDAGKITEALGSIAVAFAHVMRRQNGIEPPHKTKRRISFAAAMSGWTAHVEHEVREVAEEVERLSRAVETLQERVTFISLGIEPANIERFRRLTPSVALGFDGTPHITYMGGEPPPNLDDVRFCYDFVVGVALALQRRS